MNLGNRFIRGVTKTAKKLLPTHMVRELERYRSCRRDERSLYLKIRLSKGLGITNPARSSLPPTARTILFVCFGNIMRSPMCEAFLNKRVRESNHTHFTVMSAGLNATPDRQAHAWAIEAARDFGVSLEGHRARLLTSELVYGADAIFVMDYHNQAQLYSRWADQREKVFLLGAYLGKDRRPVEIPDPYYSGLEGTRSCYSILRTCIENLAWELFNREGDETGISRHDGRIARQS